MLKTHQWMTFFLLSIFFMTSIQAQPAPSINASYESIDGNNEYTAYDQSLRAAHWSAYLPITALVVVAILFGIADKNGNTPNSGSYDGLGSMGSRSSKSNGYTKSYHSHS